MKYWYLIIGFGISFFTFSQNDSVNNIGYKRYFEDQFYMGITYNFVRNTPEGLLQRNLSYGLQAGIIKDIPLNKMGTRAIGIGLGLGLNTYYTNLAVSETSNGFNYELDDGRLNFKRSKLETHLLEVPLEFRWRNSTPYEYRFWRVYAGFKAAYVIGARSKLVTNDYKDGFYNTDVNNFQYGLTFNFGYNTFNIHTYYSLSDLFNNNALLDGAPIAIRPLRIGFIFYIL
ncbi:porin family protein [Maribacter sp. CXY002]|uniref:porin family protein n=1 Tax=Maribacter luteocoastalis TaxID=3407671 RepID=UPI003B684BF5